MLIKQYLDKKLNAADDSAPVGTSNNPSHKILTIPNVITIARIVLTIVFFFLFTNDVNRILSLVIYVIAATTDFLDGAIARATNSVSWFGKLFDPFVDRILIFIGLLALIVTRDVPIWVIFVIVGRDAVLLCGSLILKRFRSRPIDVLFIGKVATAVLLTGFSWLLLGVPVLKPLANFISFMPLFNGECACAGILVVYAGVFLSVLTGILYVVEGALALSHSIKKS